MAIRRSLGEAKMENSWQDSYQMAVLESDWTKMEERIKTAESEIHKRRLTLTQDHGGTEQEREALVNALQSLRICGRMQPWCRKSRRWVASHNLGSLLMKHKLRWPISGEF
jgi:hypothetical protein